MACINADGTLTRSGELIILALRTPSTPEEVAQETGEALFKVRSALREFMGVGFVEAEENKYRKQSTTVTSALKEGACGQQAKNKEGRSWNVATRRRESS